MRDRIKELRRVPAKTLVANPLNWRKHPKRQREILNGVLQTIGYADALIAREDENGDLVLIDGHLRADVSPNETVPVLVVDLDEREASDLLLLHDPIAALAERDDSALDALLADFESTSAAVREFVDEAFRAPELDVDASLDAAPPRDVAVPNVFQLVVECADEAEQRERFEEIVGRGWKCRVVNL